MKIHLKLVLLFTRLELSRAMNSSKPFNCFCEQIQVIYFVFFLRLSVFIYTKGF